MGAAPVAVAPSPGPSSSDRHGGRDPLARFDPAGLVHAYRHVLSALVRRPERMAAPLLRYAGDVQAATFGAVLRALGTTNAPGPLTVDARDKRYADPAWQLHPRYWLLRQQHGLFEGVVMQLVDAADVDERTRAKARFLVRQLLSASAPPNFFFSNPAAIKAA
jgi:polyhydroxyalkanoate synthase